MDKDKQRIAIAEACGWTITLENDGVFFILRRPSGEKVYGSNIRENVAHACPDYLNDLNACHEMEKTLLGGTKLPNIYSYLMKLMEATGCPDEACYEVMCATAAQRCEAFLRTLNLWQPPTGEENE